MPIILTADQMLRKGLHFVGWDDHKRGRLIRGTKVEYFKSHFGSDPKVCADIFEDLQTTTVAAARVPPKQLDLHASMMGLHFLMVCPKDNCKAGTFKGCPRTCREWCWYYAKKIQALKSKKAGRFVAFVAGSRLVPLSFRFVSLVSDHLADRTAPTPM